MRHLLLFTFLLISCGISFSQVNITMKKGGSGMSIRNVCYKGKNVSVSFEAQGAGLSGLPGSAMTWYVDGAEKIKAKTYTQAFGPGVYGIRFQYSDKNIVDTLYVHDTLKNIDFETKQDLINSFRIEFKSGPLNGLNSSLASKIVNKEEQFYNYIWTFEGQAKADTAKDIAHVFSNLGFFKISKKPKVSLQIELKEDNTCSSVVHSNALVTNELAMTDSIVVPEAFAPNGTSVRNRFWTIKTNGEVELKISVFNRNGQLVFENQAKTIAWDGRTSNGNDCAPGPYFYVLEPQDPNYQPRKGFFYLFRDK